MTFSHRCTTAAVVLASSLVAMTAGAAGHADRKAACIASSESGQKLRHDGKLRASREQLMLCARQECPAVIRADCTQFLSEVTASTPSVVVAARDTNGRETLNVKVSIDGEQVLTKLDGKAISVDPGVHTFKYEADDGTTTQEDVGIREGEKNRVLYVAFHKTEPDAPAVAGTAATKDPAPPPPAIPTASAGTTTSKGGVPTGAYVFGGIGLLGAGLGTILLVSASSDASNLRSTCAPSCAHSDVSAARGKALFGDVAFAVGGVAIIAAVWMVLSRPTIERAPPPQSARRTLDVDVAPTQGGAAMGVHGAF